MDLEQVRELVERLRRSAESLHAVVSGVEGRVAGSTWVGPDADRFKHEWWPAARAALNQAAEGLQGLAQSALNNVTEQQQASEAGSGGAADGSAGSWVGGVGAAIGGVATAALHGAGRFVSGLDDMYKPFGSALGFIDIADWKVLRDPDLPVSRLMSDLAGDGRMKFLGHGLAAVSFAAGGYETYQTFASGDYYEGTLDAVETGVGGAAHFIPGPAGYLTGTAAEVWTDNFRVAREIDWNPTDEDYYQYMNPFVAENWTKTILPGAAEGFKDGVVMTFENLLP